MTDYMFAQEAGTAGASPAGAAPAAEADPLPADLRLQVDDLRGALHAELRPATALETILADEMAFHAAGMRLTATAENRVLRFSARRHGLLQSGGPTDEDFAVEAMFTAAMTSNAGERTERYGQVHRRAFYRAYDHLQQLRRENSVRVENSLEDVFDEEAACEMYLVGRMQANPRRCPRCSKKKYHYLRRRRRWECAGCGAQLGLRAGTVMERSPLPLSTWFAAILAVCGQPRISARNLAEQIGVPRLATVRSMAAKITSAIESAEVEELLAGLHRFDSAIPPATGARG